MHCSQGTSKSERIAGAGFTIIDNLLHSSYGPDLVMEHKCGTIESTTMLESPADGDAASNESSIMGKEQIISPDALSEDRNDQVFRDARNRTLSKHIKCRVIQCRGCNETLAT